MRSTLIRVEQANRWLLAMAIGLGAIALCASLVHKDEEALPASRPARAAAAPGPSATPVTTAAPRVAPAGTGHGVEVDLDAMALDALERAKVYEADGDYRRCLAELAAQPSRWIWSSRLGDEVREAVARKQRHCTRRLRALAEQAVREKDYPAAIALLEPVVESLQEGNFDTVTVDGAWLISDLAFAYLRNHQYVECILVSRGMALQYSGEIPEKLLKALGHNGDRCEEALDAQYAIKSGGCRISIEGAIATAVAPPALAPEGATAACVALVPDKRPPDATDDMPDPCPVASVVWKDAKGAIQRKVLSVEEHAPGDDYVPNPLIEIDFCHGLTSIARGALDGKTFVRVRGEPDGHCKGTQCVHIGLVDTFYEWNGHALAPVLDLTR
jgi:hypothetical protein